MLMRNSWEKFSINTRMNAYVSDIFLLLHSLPLIYFHHQHCVAVKLIFSVITYQQTLRHLEKEFEAIRLRNENKGFVKLS